MSKWTSFMDNVRRKFTRTRTDRGFLAQPDPGESQSFLARSDPGESPGFLAQPDPGESRSALTPQQGAEPQVEKGAELP
jgi:hypothetical protein